MSVIRKYPYIEGVIDGLSETQKSALLHVMNTPGDNVNADFKNMPEKGVTPVYFKLDETNFKTGILIYTDAGCTLIAYHRFQDVMLLKLNVADATYEKINEYCDINELRRILTVGDEVTAGEINSGNAANNKVLTADGEGGAYWSDKVNYLVLTGESGTLTAEQLAMAQLDSAVAQLGDNGKLYYKESQSNYYIVFSASPLVSGDTTYIEKITVNVTDRTWSYEAQAIAAGEGFNPEYDNALSDASTNAVQNKVITEALEEKANVDGNYPTMTVGVADNLSPYDEESGIKQHAPFNFQASGTNNGGDPTATVGSLAIMNEKRGNTVVVNQKTRPLTSSYWGQTNANATFNNGVCDFTATARDGQITQGISVNNGHKYLVMAEIKLTTSTTDVYLEFGYGGAFDENRIVFTKGTTTTQLLVTITQYLGTGTQEVLRISDYRESGWDAIQVSNVIVVDLTQWFNGDIPQDLLDNPDHFFRYYQGDLSYNEGTLVNANSRYLKAIGRNQWDEDLIKGDYIDGELDTNYPNSCSKIFRVIPNTKYYFYRGSLSVVNYGYYLTEFDAQGNFIKKSILYTTTFTTSPNTCFIAFTNEYNYGLDYKNDITISIYYEGESGYDQYYPYELLTDNDTGSEELLAFDRKLPSGLIEHNTLTEIDLGDLDWLKIEIANGKYGFSAGISGIKTASANSQVGKLKCSKYVAYSGDDVYGGTLGIALFSNQERVFIYDPTLESGDATAFKSAMSGVKLQAEKAEPTTEQGTPYSENIAIDDFGTMDFSGTSGVPQGNNLFYPVDYKAYLDTLHNYTDGDPDNLALKSDLAVVDNKIGAKLPECPTTTDGTYVLKATVSDGAVVYTWVLEE